ncbi:hypothetical protein [Vibrio crassostreae]|uniref:hypothetical protein n=1 Tax=Vibrio crassostreae TaxID=246167 RepID=UPI001B30C401|nr:hypothetical protein [Vibrio crassostreae]
MNLVEIVSLLTKSGLRHKYDGSASTFVTENLWNSDIVVEICFRRAMTLNGTKKPDRFLAALVTQGEDEIELKTLSDLRKWAMTYIESK